MLPELIDWCGASAYVKEWMSERVNGQMNERERERLSVWLSVSKYVKIFDFLLTNRLEWTDKSTTLITVSTKGSYNVVYPWVAH